MTFKEFKNRFKQNEQAGTVFGGKDDPYISMAGLLSICPVIPLIMIGGLFKYLGLKTNRPSNGTSFSKRLLAQIINIPSWTFNAIATFFWGVGNIISSILFFPIIIPGTLINYVFSGIAALFKKEAYTSEQYANLILLEQRDQNNILKPNINSILQNCFQPLYCRNTKKELKTMNEKKSVIAALNTGIAAIKIKTADFQEDPTIDMSALKLPAGLAELDENDDSINNNDLLEKSKNCAMAQKLDKDAINAAIFEIMTEDINSRSPVVTFRAPVVPQEEKSTTEIRTTIEDLQTRTTLAAQASRAAPVMKSMFS